ncbi:MAG: hypothetical protein QF902_12235, partial [Rhodospirillales bacterium]|nr:hypothetical protein [Rhodospirillales bacterium]
LGRIRQFHHRKGQPWETSVGIATLERIAVDWNCVAVLINCVNPLYFNGKDQIHVLGGSPGANAGEHDLV